MPDANGNFPAPDDLSFTGLARQVVTGGPTFAFLGDSHTAGSGAAPGILAGMSQGYAYHSLLNVLTSGRITWLGALGAAGITSRTLLNTYYPQLLRAPILPKNVVILIGGNDGSSVPLDYTLNHIGQITGDLVGRGIKPWICTNPAQGSSTTAERRWRIKLNTRLRAFASENGFELLDVFDHMTNPLTALTFNETGKMWSQTDLLHYTKLGHKELATWLAPLLLARIPLTSPYLRGITGDNSDILSGIGMFNGDANNDGVSDGWTIMTSGGTPATDSNIIYNRPTLASGLRAQNVSISSTSVFPVAGITTTLTPGVELAAGAGPVPAFVAGHIYEVSGYISTAGFDTAALAAPDSTSPNHSVNFRFLNSAGTQLGGYLGSGRLGVDVNGAFTATIVAPTGVNSTTTMEAYCTVQRPTSGSVSAQFSRLSLRDLSAADTGVVSF
jgi:lysophospholipase L1-like esterase